MPKKISRSRAAFLLNAKRAAYFLDIHAEAQSGAGAPSKPYRELPRGAVVFIIGALDAYLAELSAEVMVRDLEAAIASGEVRETMRRIQTDIPTLALELSLISSQSARFERLREVVVDHFHNRVSMHGAKAVAATCGRVGTRADDVWAVLVERGFDKPASSLDSWTDIRHQIVHQGKTPVVRRPHARACIALVDGIVEVIDGFAVS